jgi:hypothetical protein
LPNVSDRIRKSSKLRARIIAIFCNPLVQFSEAHFASAVLAARNFNKASSIQETGVQIREGYLAKLNVTESSIDTLRATPEFKAAWMSEVRKQARPLAVV